MSSHTKQPAWSELPHDILILIREKLSYKDSVRFSRVCKNWRNINKGVPWLLSYHPEKGRTTLIRHGSKTSDTDRVSSTSGLYRLPSLTRICGNLKGNFFARIDVIASKRGWLLLTDFARSTFCCYNVFTSDAMNLPDLPRLNKFVPMKATFSDEPTSQDSVIFLICSTMLNSVNIITYCKADNKWSENVFQHDEFYHSCEDVVYSKGKFYCIFRGGVGIFAPENSKFRYFNLAMPRLKSQFTTFHLAESDGEILLMLAQDGLPYFPMWKLDLEKMEFLEMERLGGRAFFISFGSTSVCAKCETESFMHKVFYPGSTNSCWCISMHKRAHTWTESYPWMRVQRTDGSKTVWVDPSN